MVDTHTKNLVKKLAAMLMQATLFESLPTRIRSTEFQYSYSEVHVILPCPGHAVLHNLVGGWGGGEGGVGTYKCCTTTNNSTI